MADWRKIIHDGIVGVQVKDAKVKISCVDKAIGTDVYSAINSHYSELGIDSPKNDTHGINYKDFTMKFASSIKAQEAAEIINAIRNDSSLGSILDNAPQISKTSDGRVLNMIIIVGAISVAVLLAIVFLLKR